ncbi:SDR family oxidoreductase [Streptomyces sp. NPDC019990]|uniref:SDR family oxidoreductase n=1 Tax=Streptomyces sp. NPDC019990 TaxID=3154693 RepID=UPI0033CFBDE8
MKAVVHRGSRTLGTGSRGVEAPALAMERGGRDAKVGALPSGCTATGTTEALRADPQRDQVVLGRIPAGRSRRADHPAGAAAVLASPAPDYVNGIVLAVDGGWPGR